MAGKKSATVKAATEELSAAAEAKDGMTIVQCVGDLCCLCEEMPEKPTKKMQAAMEVDEESVEDCCEKLEECSKEFPAAKRSAAPKVGEEAKAIPPEVVNLAIELAMKMLRWFVARRSNPTQ